MTYQRKVQHSKEPKERPHVSGSSPCVGKNTHITIDEQGGSETLDAGEKDSKGSALSEDFLRYAGVRKILIGKVNT